MKQNLEKKTYQTKGIKRCDGEVNKSLEPLIFLDKTTVKLTSNICIFLTWTGHSQAVSVFWKCFFPLFILTSKCNLKENTVSQVPNIVSLLDPLLSPAEKFIIS